MKNLLLAFLFILLATTAKSQNGFLQPSEQFNAPRFRGVIASEVGLGVLVTTGLYFLWYRKHPMNHFHYFNDNSEWLQMDKIGHATTAYNIAAVQYDLMRWSGLQNQPSIAVGAITALGYMSIIEVLDGFSSQWGFSKGDMAANLIGAALFAGQQKFWGGQRVSLKFSYHQTIYPTYHPEELGSNWRERMLKDYNGQTYWLSFNIKSFLPAQSHFPAWLNMNVGYSAEGMTGANSNPILVNGKPIPTFKRYRQFFLSPDVDWSRISSGNYLFNAFGYLSKTVKTPLPALELDSLKTLKLKGLYF